MAAQVIINKNNLESTVIAAKNVKEPIAANAKAAIPKNKTEFAGVRNFGLTSPNHAGSDFSRARAYVILEAENIELIRLANTEVATPIIRITAPVFPNRAEEASKSGLVLSAKLGTATWDTNWISM